MRPYFPKVVKSLVSFHVRTPGAYRIQRNRRSRSSPQGDIHGLAPNPGSLLHVFNGRQSYSVLCAKFNHEGESLNNQCLDSVAAIAFVCHSISEMFK